MKKQVERDERTVIVEKSGFYYAYLFMGFALLINIAYKGFIMGESAFDLLAILVLSGFVSVIYQAKHKTLSRTWFKNIIMTFLIAVVIAIMIATLR
ncbi:hypothetical protein SAMN05446037_10717 [Anaerovirgula multivorans]|uniref:Uncharacterized protein n=1 Tax=Anaerovirgula multivorans TaxID=312168 RepID=A0A239LBJ5_9FIRM|nr:hypothetical protein [Anaerovirgula multivorans]SNT27841.1 hypothetical protein SAMN05446037_10717 [Anaerovirgula multivorans]